MTAGTAIGSQAIGDATRRELASEWGGAEPAGPRAAVRCARPAASGRRVTVRRRKEAV